jgi:BMFP domain-containing protein YqiC
MAKQLTSLIASEHSPQDGIPGPDREPEPDNIIDLINKARKASAYAQDMQAEVDAARKVARESFDAVYEMLLQVKAENATVIPYRESKLGKLLENAR